MHGSDVEIYLAAHSMGGLVARYFLQSGDYDNAPGIDRITAFLTFGTPHKGAVVALAAALGQHKANFLSMEQSRKLANDPRFLGLYDLFPQAGGQPIWESGGKGRLKSHDVFDPIISQKLKLNASSLVASAKNHAKVSGPWPKIRTFMFVGTRFETMTHLLWDGAKAVVVRTRDGGDGTVNLQGAMLENQQIRLTDHNHMTLIKADETRAALQDLFNAYGVLLAAGSSVTLTAAEHFIASNQPIEVLLVIKGDGAEVHGKLFLERSRIPKDVEALKEADFVGAVPEAVQELDYNGPNLTMMNIKFEGVVGPAALRPVFETLETPPRRFVGPTFLVMAAD